MMFFLFPDILIEKRLTILGREYQVYNGLLERLGHAVN